MRLPMQLPSATTVAPMDRTLRNRLFFGAVMLAALFLLLWLDSEAQRRTRPWMETHFAAEHFRGGIGGIGLLVLLAVVLPIATGELATLFAAERVKPYRFIAAVGSTLLALHAFLTQFPPFQPVAASSFAFII